MGCYVGRVCELEAAPGGVRTSACGGVSASRTAHFPRARLRAQNLLRRRVRGGQIRARQLTPGVVGELPSFVVIGGQRCGTTSLFADFNAHPLIRPPVTKELQYFTLNYARGLSWYRACFPRLRPGEFTFEASPFYLFDPAVPARACVDLPDTKFVAMLRNPAERAYSHYTQSCALGQETLSFADALEAEPERLARARATGGARATTELRAYSYFSRGLYAQQLRQWFAHVDPAQMIVLRSEDMFDQPAPTYARLLDFLRIRQHAPARFYHQNSHPRDSTPDFPAALRAELTRRYAEPNQELGELLGWSQTWPAY